MTTREIGLNNPCGLKKVPPIKWQGLAPDQPDATLCKFISPEMGLRAPIKNLLTYGNRGWNTTRKIITEWVPPDPTGDQNPTEQYIKNVCEWCGWDADDQLELDSADTMRPLIKAIVRQENGTEPYSDSVIDNAMRLAGISDVPAQAIMASKTSQGISIATVGTGMAAASEGVRQLQDIQETVDGGLGVLHWLISFGPSIAIAFIIAGGALAVYDYWQKRKRLGI